METGPRGPVTDGDVDPGVPVVDAVAMETGPRGPVTGRILRDPNVSSEASQWRPAREGR